MHKSLLFFLCLFFSDLFACTNFSLEDKSKHFVVGRSMEFAIDLESKIIIVPRGIHQQSQVKNQTAMSWTQRYGFAGLNAFNNDRMIADGINEKGLSIGGLWFPETEYPKLRSYELSRTINLQDLGTWILGMFATVKEVEKALHEIAIFPEPLKGLGEVPPLHLAIHDQLGGAIVVEFVKGKMNIYDNSVGVLTNSPNFEWQVTNLRNYLSLSSRNVSSKHFDGAVLSPTGQGNGMFGLPGDWTPPSRFVRIAAMKAFISKAQTRKENVNLAFHLLNTVDIPRGVVESSKGDSADYTQWIVVKDLTGGKLYYRTYDNLNIHSIDLSHELRKGFHRIDLK